MPRQKRRYVPKTKGCYECSQRRIHCDRAQPRCGKCESRDLPCSGLGIRYRFRDEARGKMIKWNNSPRGQQSTLPQYAQTFPDGSQDTWPGLSDEFAETFWSELGSNETHAGIQAMSTLGLYLNPVDPSSEFMLTYFSDNIAPQMVVMDDQYNGWRYLTLPMTLSDEMLMNAVLAVSAFHISHRTEGRLPVKPNKLYAQAILGLQSRRALNDFDMATRQSVFLTIIILMVGVMITGCSDFPILFHMLQSALDAIGGESGLGGGEIAEFLMRQIHKMRVYAAPLLSPEAGVHHILAYSQQSFDCLHYNGDLHPDHASTFYLVAYLRQQAYDIYLQRALAGPSAVIQPDLVERYKSTLDLFAHDSPGTHSLIWPTFIAASESRLAEHRLHFKQFLEVQYRSNGFSNILEALKLLERIWACQDTNWTALLPEPRVFIM